MLGLDFYSYFLATAKPPKPWNDPELIPWEETSFYAQSIGSEPRRDSGVDISDDLGIIPKDEVLRDFGPIGSGRPRKFYPSTLHISKKLFRCQLS